MPPCACLIAYALCLECFLNILFLMVIELACSAEGCLKHLKGFTGVARNNCFNWATWWFLQSMGSMFSSQQVQCNIHCNCRLWRAWGFQMLHGLVLRKGKHEECFPRGREEWRGHYCQGEQSSSLSRNPVSDTAHHYYTTLCFIYCDPSQESDH